MQYPRLEESVSTLESHRLIPVLKLLLVAKHTVTLPLTGQRSSLPALIITLQPNLLQMESSAKGCLNTLKYLLVTALSRKETRRGYSMGILVLESVLQARKMLSYRFTPLLKA